MSISTQLISGWLTVSSSTTTYYGNPYGGVGSSSTETTAQTIISTPGTIKNLRVLLSAAPGSGGSGKKYDITLYKNGVATTLTVNILETATSGTDLFNQISVVAGDTITIQVKPTNSPTVVTATWNVSFIPTTPGETILLSNSAGSIVFGNDFIPIAGGSEESIEVQSQLVIPCSGTIKNLYIKVGTTPGGITTYIFTVRKNGVGQSTVVTLTGTATTGNDTSNNFTVAAGDLISIRRTGTSGNNPLVNAGITFVPDTIGQFIISRIARTTALQNNQYISLFNSGSIHATEGNIDEIFSSCILKNLYVILSTAPGGVTSRTFTLRQNASSKGLTVTISGANTSGNSSIDINIADNDLLDTLLTLSGSPAASKASISYTGYIAPVTTETETINSNVHFKKTGIQEDINSDVHFHAIGTQKTITSDICFSASIFEDIISDIHFKKVGIQKGITSDVYFVKRETILSDVHFQKSGIQETITSDVYFLTTVSSKFIHDRYLYLITDTSPAKLIRVNITVNPPTYTIYTLDDSGENFNLGKELVINHSTEQLYVSFDEGYVAKISLSNPNTRQSFYVGEDKQLVSIAHNPTYLTTFIADTDVDSLFIIDEATYATINSDIRTRKLVTAIVNTFINTWKGIKILTDFRTRKQTTSKINTDLRFLKATYNEITYTNPIARTDFHVKIDGTEIVDNDLKLDSIKINHTADNKSTASFTLTRKHDDIDNPVEISDNNVVTIFIKDILQFTGKIIKLDCSSSSEQIDVSCESDIINEDYGIVTKELPLTKLNEQIHLYDVLLNDVSIDNSYVDTRLVISGDNGRFWNGSDWVFHVEDALTFNTHADTETYMNSQIPVYYQTWYTYYLDYLNFINSGDIINKDSLPNAIFFNQNPKVDNYETNPAHYNGIKINLGKEIHERPEVWSVVGATTVPEELEDGTFKFKPNYTYFWQVDVQWFDLEGGYRPSGWVYIGTSLAPLSSDLYEIVGASYRYQRILDDDVFELGYYTLGTAPFKEISAKNGKKIARPRWEDKEDGLYYVQSASYDYVQYCKDIATIEFEKIKNINGNILPSSVTNIDLTIDGYLYYGLKLLTRLNLVNTTVIGIYNDDNGFPISTKQISIDSNSMKVSLSCDNIKSEWELERLTEAYPEEPLEYGELNDKYLTKYDLSNNEEVD